MYLPFASRFFFFFAANTSVAAASTQCYNSSLECFFKKGKEILQNSETEFCLCSYTDSPMIDTLSVDIFLKQ